MRHSTGNSKPPKLRFRVGDLFKNVAEGVLYEVIGAYMLDQSKWKKV